MKCFSRSDPTENDSVEGLRPNARGPGLVTFGVSAHYLLFCEMVNIFLLISWIMTLTGTRFNVPYEIIPIYMLKQFLCDLSLINLECSCIVYLF